MDRILTSINFIESNIDNLNKITWYLSGGIKFEGDLSEASIMKNELNTLIENKVTRKNIKFNYILDEVSKNTAENFYRSSKFLNTTLEKYNEIYIITSKFHYDRAKLMLSLIDSSRDYNWILGNLQQHDSYYWENIHIKNVFDDVNKLYRTDEL